MLALIWGTLYDLPFEKSVALPSERRKAERRVITERADEMGERGSCKLINTDLPSVPLIPMERKEVIGHELYVRQSLTDPRGKARYTP